MGSNLKDVREWMRVTETFLNLIKNNGNLKQDKIQSKIEVRRLIEIRPCDCPSLSC